MSDLRERLLAAVNERLELAREAAEGSSAPWYVDHKWNVVIADAVDFNLPQPLAAYGVAKPYSAHIAANDPAAVIRHCERDLKVLERHAPKLMIAGWDRRIVSIDCATCHVPGDDYDDYGNPVEYPCPETADLAAAYALDSALPPRPPVERGTGSAASPPG